MVINADLPTRLPVRGSTVPHARDLLATLSNVESALAVIVADSLTKVTMLDTMLAHLTSNPAPLVFASPSSVVNVIVEVAAATATTMALVALAAAATITKPLAFASPSNVANAIVVMPADTATELVVLITLPSPVTAAVMLEPANALPSKRANAIVAPLADSVTVMLPPVASVVALVVFASNFSVANALAVTNADSATKPPKLKL